MLSVCNPNEKNSRRTPLTMNKDLNTPIWQLTIGEFIEFQRKWTEPAPPKDLTVPSNKKYVYGLAGLAKLFGCSTRAASTLKSSGKIDKAVIQNGRKIVKGGSVYKNANDVAIGLVFRDIDVTEGPQPGAVMIAGYVLASRLPVVVSDEDKATMKNIVFKDEYDSQANA